MRKKLLGLTLLVFVSVTLAPNAAWSGPRDGLNLGGGVTLSPFVEGSLTYDSNVWLAPDGQETNDFYYGLVGGLSLMKHTETMLVNLRGWYRFRRYDEFDELDDETWQENFDFVWGDISRVQLKLNQRHSEVSDYEFSQAETGAEGSQSLTLRLLEGRTRRTTRELDDIGLSASRQTDKLMLVLGAGYGWVDFESVDLLAWEEGTGDADVAYQITEKTMAMISGSLGWQNTDNGLRGVEFSKLRIGMRSQQTRKITCSVGVGVESYRADDSSGSSEALDEDILHYNLGAAWAMTEKISLQTFARNEILPTSAFADNAKQVDQFSLGVLWRLPKNWQTSLGGSYRQDDYLRMIAGIDAVEEISAVQWKLRYAPTDKVVNLTLNIRYEEFESNIQDDYNQLRASIIANLTY